MGRLKNDSPEAVEARVTAQLAEMKLKMGGFTLAVSQFREAIEKLEHRVEALEKQSGREASRVFERLGELEGGLGQVDHRMDTMAREAADAHTQREIERRVSNIEQDISRLERGR